VAESLTVCGAVVVVSCGALLTFGRKVNAVSRSYSVKSPNQLFEASDNPVLAALKEIQASGEAAMNVFMTSELNLCEYERAGTVPPGGLSYEEWHQVGAMELRNWLIGVGPEVERLMGHKALLGMRYQVARAQVREVEAFVREDYRDLWRHGRKHIDWISALVAKGSEMEAVK
jgi:hypothetical protein